MFIRVITFDEACSKAPDASPTSWNDRTYWLYDLQERRWDWPVWGKLFKVDSGKQIHKTKEAVESILTLGNVEYEVKRNGISIYKANYNDHWYMIVKSIDGLIAVEEVLS